MSFIRERLIGLETTFNSTIFIPIDLSGPIDLSQYITQNHIETNPIHLMVHMMVTDKAGGTGMGFISHFTISKYTSSDYIYCGIPYSLECPIYFETFNDGDFDLVDEGIQLTFSGDEMTITTSVVTPNGLDLTVNSYFEMYLNSDVQ
jgi:hypothetical protein